MVRITSEGTALTKTAARLHNPKLRNRLILAFVVLIIPPFLILSYISYGLFSEHFKNQARSLALQIMQENKDRIENSMKLCTSISERILYSTSLQAYFSQRDITFIEEYETVTKSIDLMNGVLAGTEGFVLTVYTSNPSIPESYNLEYDYSHNDFTLKNHNTFIPCNILRGERVSQEPWYQAALSGSLKGVWSRIGNDKSEGRLSLLYRFYNFNTLATLGVLRISIPEESIFGLEKDDSGHVWSLMIMGGDGDLLYKNNDTDLFYLDNNIDISQNWSTGQTVQEIAGVEYMLISEDIPQAGWKIFGHMPLNEIDAASLELGTLTLVVTLMTTALLILLSCIISQSLTRRLSSVSAAMQRVAKEESFDVCISEQRNDEVGILIAAFNTMMGKINTLIREVYAEKIKKKEAELLLLQAQVNPHFLYNTLACIESEAHETGAKNAAAMVKSLSRFYRLSLSKGNDVITLREELELVRAYVSVQGIRFDDKVHVSYDLDENALECKTLKFILQPFLENTYMHAIYRRKKPVAVLISAKKQGDALILSITDDGSGMPVKVLEGLMVDGKSSSENYGIKNVDERIKLHYGEQYGIRVESREGSGTRVQIHIPVF